jgi:ligand-binding SRPBCC domain-containing protein
MIHRLSSHQTVRATIEDVWEFFSRPANLNVITPPSLHFRILAGDAISIYNGQIITYSIRILPFLRIKWVTEIKDIVPFSSFIDEQRAGPYKYWHHYHQFVKTDHGVDIIDTVHYEIGFSFFGELAYWLWVKHQLSYIFRYRREKIAALIAAK